MKAEQPEVPNRVLSSTNLKRVSAALGVVAVGAIGSGVWEVVFKPTLAASRDFFLDVITLGTTTLKESTYQQIPLYTADTASYEVYGFLVLAICLGASGTALWMHLRARDQVARARKLLGDARSLGSRLEAALNEREPAECERLKEKIGEAIAAAEKVQKPARVMRFLVYSQWVSALFLCSFVAGRFVQLSYVRSAANHFERTLAVVAPDIDRKSCLQYQSRFFRLAGRADYIQLVSELESLATKNERPFRAFRPW